MTETLGHGYSSESTLRDLDYPVNVNKIGFKMLFKNLCVLVLWMKVASAFKGFKDRDVCKSTSLVKN